MNKQPYIIGGIVLVFFVAAALFALRSPEYTEDMVDQLNREAPFEHIVIPEKHDAASRAVIEQNIEKTKELFATTPDTWETWVAIGNMYLQLEDYVRAITAYEISSDVQQNFIGIRNIAQVYEMNLRDYTKAEAVYRDAINANLLLVQNYVDLGRMLYKKLDRTGDAEDVFRDGLVNTPAYPDMLLQLIQLYQHTGDDDALREVVTLLLERFPTDQYKKAYSTYLQ